MTNFSNEIVKNENQRIVRYQKNIDFFNECIKQGIDFKEFNKEIRAIQKLDKINKNYEKIEEVYQKRIDTIKKKHTRMRLEELKSIDGLFTKARKVGDRIDKIFSEDKKKNLRRKAHDFLTERTKSVNHKSLGFMKNTQHYKIDRIRTEYSRSILT